MNREQVLTVLYDLAMVIGGEVRLQPLLTRCVQRLLYHTSFPVGLVLLEPFAPAGDALRAELEVAIGDYRLSALAGRTVDLPRALVAGGAAAGNDASLPAALPAAARYETWLRLPIPQQGVILLLAPHGAPVELQLAEVFQPVLANLAKAIMLCRDHEAREAGLVAERDAARLGQVESAETVRAIAGAAPDAIVICDAEGLISYWNPAAARIFGWSPREAVGRPLHALLTPPRYRRDAERAFRTYQATGQGPALGGTHEYEGLRKDGTEFPLELSLSPLQFRGRPAALGLVRDITERRRAQERLRRSQRLDALGQLAGGVAHDFNNLLVVINGCCELALDGLPPDAPVRGDLEQIQSAGKRAAALTRQLLAFGRKQALNPVVLSPNAVIAGLDELLRRLIGEDVELRTELAPEVGNVLADPWQLEQVLVNLVVNARDAMPSGGVVTIDTADVELDAAALRAAHPDAAPGPYVRLRITDTGVGMDAATMARMFEPFFTTKPAGKGTGLGLATVYGIVRQSGGAVDVQSERGMGTSFAIFLPRATRAPAEPAAPAAAAPGPIPAGKAVLVVEDDPGVRLLTARILRPLGYEVLEAETPAQALALSDARRGPVHLLVTDVVMPGMDGVMLAAALRRARPELAVLYMSGHGGAALSGRGESVDGASFVAKPFTAGELAGKVREALERARSAAGA